MLIGYASRFSTAPGEPLSFMLSGDGAVEGRLVRLLHGDERSPIGLVEHEIESSLSGTWTLEPQQMHTGSFGVVSVPPLREDEPLSGSVLVQPTLVGLAAVQGIWALLDDERQVLLELTVQKGGDLRLASPGAGTGARIQGALRNGHWHEVRFSIEAGEAQLSCSDLTSHQADQHAQGACNLPGPRMRSMLLAARQLLDRPGEPRAAGTFNGMVERPVFSGLFKRSLLDLDLGSCSQGWEIWDQHTGGVVGRLYNAPLRQVPSSAWRGKALAPSEAPSSFAAVHFHDDDAHHADWQPTIEWTVPKGIASGVYALRLTSGDTEDRVPFIVRPPRGEATEAVALWLPSFTYAAYANARGCMAPRPYGTWQPVADPGDEQLDEHPEWGISAYDLHSDGTGAALSSLARPIPNLRPTFRAGLVDGPRHFAADLYLVHWLEQLGIPIDMIADEDVHAEGFEILARYTTVITGSHPEYVTAEQLDAVESYTNGGGRLMYMGGNGFFWVTSVAPDETTLIEVRRGHNGTRCWDAAPGTQYHQLTGEPGGLWRHRGRPPHALVGVGFVSEGWDGANRPYQRTDAAREQRCAWAFAGIPDDAVIGEAGFIMAGAAGDELDSADPMRGTPEESIVLASSSSHSDAYWVTLEDLLENEANLDGTHDSRVRSDITLTPKPAGGAVFAVGSISFTGALGPCSYKNPAARLCENVLRTFVSGAAPWESPG